MTSASKHRTGRMIIIEDGRVLLLFRRRWDQKQGREIEYYSIPGGKIDEGELPDVAAIRELHEELGVTVELLRPIPLAHGVGEQHEHFVYLGRITKGVPHLMENSEEAERMRSHNDHYEMRWVPIGELTSDTMFYYNTYVPLIRDISRGKIPEQTIALVDKWV